MKQVNTAAGKQKLNQVTLQIVTVEALGQEFLPTSILNG